MPFIRQIDFSQHIKTICNDIAPVKFSAGLVKIRVVEDITVWFVCADAQVVANGVIPAQTDVRITQIYLHGRYISCCCHDSKSQSAASQGASPKFVLTFIGLPLFLFSMRSEERRVGKECISRC